MERTIRIKVNPARYWKFCVVFQIIELIAWPVAIAKITIKITLVCRLKLLNHPIIPPSILL